MKSALFKIYSKSADDIGGIMAEADIIFCRDPETGIGPDGYGWHESHRIDEDYIAVGICTDDAVMDMIMLDPRLELIQQTSGWPEPEAVVKDEITL